MKDNLVCLSGRLMWTSDLGVGGCYSASYLGSERKIPLKLPQLITVKQSSVIRQRKAGAWLLWTPFSSHVLREMVELRIRVYSGVCSGKGQGELLAKAGRASWVMGWRGGWQEQPWSQKLSGLESSYPTAGISEDLRGCGMGLSTCLYPPNPLPKGSPKGSPKTPPLPLSEFIQSTTLERSKEWEVTLRMYLKGQLFSGLFIAFPDFPEI